MFPVEGVLDSYKRQELGDPKLYAEADKYQALFYSGSILKDEYIKKCEEIVKRISEEIAEKSNLVPSSPIVARMSHRPRSSVAFVPPSELDMSGFFENVTERKPYRKQRREEDDILRIERKSEAPKPPPLGSQVDIDKLRERERFMLEIARLKEEHRVKEDRLMEDIKQLKVVNMTIKEEIVQMNKLNEGLEVSREELKQLTEEKKNNDDRLNVDIVNLQRELDVIRDAYNILETGDMEGLKRVLEEKNAMIIEMAKQNHTLSIELANKQTEIDVLGENMRRQLQDKDKLIETFEKSGLEKDELMRTRTDEIARSKQELSARDVSLLAMSENVAKLETDMIEKDHELGLRRVSHLRTETEIKTLQSRAAVLEGELNRAKADSKLMGTQIEGLNFELGNARSEMTVRNEELRVSLEEVTRLKAEIEEIKRVGGDKDKDVEMDRLKTRVIELEQEAVALNKSFDELREGYRLQDTLVNQLKIEKEELEKETRDFGGVHLRTDDEDVTGEEEDMQRLLSGIGGGNVDEALGVYNKLKGELAELLGKIEVSTFEQALEKLDKMKEEADEKEARYVNQGVELTRYADLYNTATRINHDMVDNIANMQTQIDKLRTEVKDLETNNTTLNGDLQKLLSGIGDESVNEALGMYTKLKGELTELLRKIEVGTFEQALEKLDKMKEDAHTNATQFVILDGEIIRLKDELDKITKMNDSASGALINSHSEIETLKTNVKELEVRNEKLVNEVKELRDGELKVANETVLKIQGDLSKALVNVDIVKKELQTKDAKITELGATITRLEGEFGREQTGLIFSSERLGEAERDIVTLKDEKTALENELKGLREGELKTANDNMVTLKDELQRVLQKIGAVTSEQALVKLDEMNGEAQKKDVFIAALKKANVDLDEENKRMKRVSEKFGNVIGDRDAIIRDLENEKDENEITISNLKEELRKAEAINKEIETALVTSVTSMATYVNETAKLNEMINVFKSERETQIASLNAQMDGLKKQFTLDISIREATISTLTVEKDDLKRQHGAMLKKIEAAVGESEDSRKALRNGNVIRQQLEMEIEKLKNDNMTVTLLKTQVDERLAGADKRIKELQDANNELSRKIGESDVSIVDLNAQLHTAHDDIIELKYENTEVAALKSRLVTVRLEIGVLEEKVGRLKQENASLQTTSKFEIDELNVENTILKGKVTSLEGELQKVKQETATQLKAVEDDATLQIRLATDGAERRVKAAKEDVERMVSAVKIEAEKQISDIKKKVEEEEVDMNKHKALITENDRLKTENATMKNQVKDDGVTIKYYNQLMEDTRGDNVKLRNELENEKREKARLGGELNRMVSNETDGNRVLVENARRLETELAEARRLVTQGDEVNSQLRVEMSKMRDKIAATETSLTSVATERDKLSTELSDARKNARIYRESSSKMVVDLQYQVKQLTKEIEDDNDKMESVFKRESVLIDREEKVSQDEKVNAEKINAYVQLYENEKKRADGLDDVNKNIGLQLKERIEQLETENSDLKKKLDERYMPLEDVRVQARLEEARLAKEIEDLKQKNVKLNDAWTDAQTRLQTSGNTAKMLDSERNALEKKMNDQIAVHRQRQAVDEEKIKQLEAYSLTLQRQLADSEQQAGAIITQLEDNIRGLEQYNVYEDEKRDEFLAKLSSDEAHINHEINSLQDRLVDQELENELLRGTNTELVQEIIELRAERNQTFQQIAESHVEHMESKQRDDMYIERINELTDIIEQKTEIEKREMEAFSQLETAHISTRKKLTESARKEGLASGVPFSPVPYSPYTTPTKSTSRPTQVEEDELVISDERMDELERKSVNGMTMAMMDSKNLDIRYSNVKTKPVVPNPTAQELMTRGQRVKAEAERKQQEAKEASEMREKASRARLALREQNQKMEAKAKKESNALSQQLAKARREKLESDRQAERERQAGVTKSGVPPFSRKQ